MKTDEEDSDASADVSADEDDGAIPPDSNCRDEDDDIVE